MRCSYRAVASYFCKADELLSAVVPSGVSIQSFNYSILGMVFGDGRWPVGLHMEE
jgi:hypothetical protein